MGVGVCVVTYHGLMGEMCYYNQLNGLLPSGKYKEYCMIL